VSEVFLDLPAYLAFLERGGSGRPGGRPLLQRVTAPVDKDRELACIVRWVIESTLDEEAYALLFENVTGSGSSSGSRRAYDMPVAVNLYPTHELYAAAIGATVAGMFEHWAGAMEHPREPIVVPSGDVAADLRVGRSSASRSPVQEVVESGAAVDLSALPVPVWTPGRDAGPYLSAANVITKDPQTGVQNLASYRIQIHDERRVGLFFGSRLQHGAMHLARWRQRNEPMPVALVVGAAPVVNFAAAAKTAYGVDELTLAGGLAGQPIEVVRGKTVDLLVPARAECVIEGVVRPDAIMPEGPFGEALGYMNEAAPAAFVEVTALCRRENAVHHGYVQQLPPSEGHIVMEMGVLGPLWYYLTRKLRVEGLSDMAIARGSAGVATLVVQLRRDRKSEASAIGHTLAKMNFGQKFIYLVDEDIDVRDPEAVNWAISSRVDPQRDIRLIDGVNTFQLDPSVLARARADGVSLTEPPYKSSLAVVDATLKTKVPEISIPGASWMEAVRARWDEFQLPVLLPRRRLQRLLDTHSDSGMNWPGPK